MKKVNKFKLYDKNKNEIVKYSNCSIAIDDGGVQSFNKSGEIEGTLVNRHLVPLEYVGKNDIDGNGIYENFIIQRTYGSPGEEDIIGVVIFDECSWWIENKKQQRAVPLFDEIAVDKIIGNIYQNPELIK
ncbi:YopX family protein [Clostridium botulinum]|uniref:YopX family protein n=1 Tax=Clostridium botulinum TaxID=1491 RepID=UPI0007743819|nr:YopX family protein [Clostridium botulinum]